MPQYTVIDGAVFRILAHDEDEAFEMLQKHNNGEDTDCGGDYCEGVCKCVVYAGTGREIVEVIN